jgi:Flavin containing amine oxidoreductase
MRDAKSSLEVTIVGGGVAGLTAALRLAERGVAVTILEKGPLMGGNLSGVWHAGACYDVYPHMFCEWYTNFWSLAEDVGLRRGQEFEKRSTCGLLRAKDFPNYRCFTDAGSFRTLWENITSGVLTIPEMFIADYTILDLLSEGGKRKEALENQTLNDFISEKYYATPAVTEFFNATVTNVWSIDSYLSSALAYQSYAKYQFREPTPQCWVVKGDSYQQIVTPLLNKLEKLKFTIRTSTAVTGVTVENGEIVGISYSQDGGQPEAQPVDNLILAVPPSSLADIIFARSSGATQGDSIVGILPQLANVRRLASAPLPLLYVRFRRKLADIPEFYVALLESNYSLTFVEVKDLSERAQTTVLAIAASDFNALPVNLASPVDRHGELDRDWMVKNPGLSEAAFLILSEFRRYVPFKLGSSFLDPDSDVDWDNTFFQPNLDQQLFINEVSSQKYCTTVNYSAIENLYFAGDTCINPITIATVESGVYSGLQAANAIAGKYRLDPVRIIEPRSYPAPLLWPWKIMLQPYAVVAKMWADFENAAGLGSSSRGGGGAASPMPSVGLAAGALCAQWWKMMNSLCRQLW